MPTENLQAVLLFIAACSAAGALCSLACWAAVGAMRQRYEWMAKDLMRLHDAMRDIRDHVGDLHSDLREAKRLSAERDKMMRAAAGVKIEVK